MEVKGTKKILKCNQRTQTNPEPTKKDCGTQCCDSDGSYSRGVADQRRGDKKVWRYDDLAVLVWDKDLLIQWLMSEKLLASRRVCPVCNSTMKLTKVEDRSDGLKWECRKQDNGKRHKVEASIRKDSWFEESNLTLEEQLKITYWWCCELNQKQIRHELGISGNTGVDWDRYCREICEVNLLENGEMLGGEGKEVQIDESKFGKRKYHRGHRVEGQWVFGGIDSDSRKTFMVAVEKRDEATLLPIIKRWIKPGSVIVSDCMKGYTNLEREGYVHKIVNHSKEFVNKDGFHTNKIEGHWRQAKVKMPVFGIRKYMFSSYLAEFMWRYKHKEDDLFAVFLDDVKKIYRF